MLLRHFLLPLLGALLCATDLSAQVSSAINPTADAFVTTGPVATDRSGNNYGGAGALGVSASGKPQGEFQSVIKFNLASTIASFNSTYGPGQWTLQSVTLQLTAQNPANNAIFNANAAGSFNIIWQQNDFYAEGTGTPASSPPATDGVTFATLPSFQSGADLALGTFSFNGAISGSFTYTLLLPPGFINDIEAGGDVSLRLFAADANVSYVFNSRSFGTPSARPLLTVTAVPEPGTLVFAFLGAGLFAFAARRRLTSRCA